MQNKQWVTNFKLLRVTITDSFRWAKHITVVTTKASKHLWFIKKLKQAGVSQSDLVCYYEVVWNAQSGTHLNSQMH